MKTAKEYREKLLSMRRNVYLDGKLVDRDDPRLLPGVNVIALTYDLAQQEEYEGIATAISHLDGRRINRFCHVNQNAEDLLSKQKMVRIGTQKVGKCLGRCMGLDAINALAPATYDMDKALGTEYNQRFLKYLAYFQENDIAGSCAQTDVKGDRSKHPHQQADPDLYVRIVEKGKDGIIVRGAKNHITTVPYAEEMVVVPTRALTKEESDWAVAFAIPADAEGVRLISQTAAPRGRKRLKAPVAEYGNSESFVVFDNTFVPWERVFMCGETEFAGQLALLFALYHRHSYTGCKPAFADVMMGTAALVAEYSGLERVEHVREKLADIISAAELVYATGIAGAMEGHKSPSGTFIPNAIYCNIGRRYAGETVYHEHQILADISGGLPSTIPSEDSFYNKETARFLEKYIMRNPKIPAEYQHRCFRLVRDLICSEYGGVWQFAGLHGGGSPSMETRAILVNYNMEEKKKIAKYLAGIPWE